MSNPAEPVIPQDQSKSFQELFDEDQPSATFRALHDKFEAVFWAGVNRNRQLTEQDQEEEDSAG